MLPEWPYTHQGDPGLDHRRPSLTDRHRRCPGCAQGLIDEVLAAPASASASASSAASAAPMASNTAAVQLLAAACSSATRLAPASAARAIACANAARCADGNGVGSDARFNAALITPADLECGNILG